ncbi:MAG: hypothetical protein AAF915_18050 [Cyanobacteria bacterium P01_D01_bin.50]
MINNNQDQTEAPWCIFRSISSGYQMCIARTKTRGEIEKYYKSLRQLMPNAQLTIVFTTEDLRREQQSSFTQYPSDRD